jgi:hypothetical protein
MHLAHKDIDDFGMQLSFIYIQGILVLSRLASAWVNGTSVRSAFIVQVLCPA